MKLVKDKRFLHANLILILSLMIFFYRPLFTDRIQVPSDILQTYPFFKEKGLSPYPQNAYLTDPVLGFIPYLAFNKASLEQGHLPFWNPYQACGLPDIANILSAFFYPLNFFVYLFGLKWGLFFLYFFKLYFAGIFMYLYTRKIGIKHELSVTGSCALMFAGFNTAFLYWTQTNLAFYLPLGMLATELIVDTPNNVKGYLLLSIGSIVAVFGGHPEMLFYEASILVVYFIFRLFQNRARGYTKTILLRTSLFIFIAVLISAVQWLPFLQYLYYSYIYMLRSSHVNAYYVPSAVMFISIVPDFLSAFLKPDIININVIMSGFPLPLGYVGITMLLFFVIGLFRFYKNTLALFFTAILFYIGIVAFHVPILHNFITLLPIFRVSANTWMFGCSNIFVILIALMAMNSFFENNIQSGLVKYSILIIILITVILLVVYLFSINVHIDPFVLKEFYFYTVLDVVITFLFLSATVGVLKVRNTNLKSYLLLLLVFSQTALPMMHYETAIKPAYLYPQNKIIKILKSEPPPFRAFPIISHLSQWAAWDADINTYYTIEDLRGFDVLGIKWYELLYRTMPSPDFLNLANVKYIVLNKDGILPPPFDVEFMAEDNGYVLYKNLSAFNRAFMVYAYRIAHTDDEFLKLTLNYAAQLRNLAVIPNQDIQYASFNPDSLRTNNHGEIRFVSYHPSSIEMEVDTPSPGLLVISNAYFPGWKAYVDNKESKLIRTDFAFDGVFLQGGKHIVVLKYRPLSFMIGLWLGLCGLICLFLLVRYIRFSQ